MTFSEILSLNNPVFSCFAFCSALLVLKMFLLSFMTSKARGDNNAFANPEDSKLFGKGKVKKEMTTNTAHPDVERLRRNHLNDLENTPAFIFVGLLYLFIQPAPATAIMHFRAFTIIRFCHMLCYQLAIPQPSRALSYLAGILITISMAVQVLMAAKF